MHDPLRNALRQQRFRARRDARLSALDKQARRIIDAIADACDRGRCPALTNHLPDPPQEALAEIVRRLSDRRLIVCGPEDTKTRKTQKSPGPKTGASPLPARTTTHNYALRPYSGAYRLNRARTSPAAKAQA